MQPAVGCYRYDSDSNDVQVNLAREEYLFDTLPPGSRALIFYVDSSAVVFGKHQNPWRECSVRELARRDIALARRISGGGTVYHDLGNLNFSFIQPKEGFDRRANLAIIVRALSRLGVHATISDRHDLMLDGRKISGNAFCFRRDRALHHGTLLVRSALEALRGALVGMDGIETHAVESNPSPVVNIGALHPTVELPAIVESIAEEVAVEWDAGSPLGATERLTPIDDSELDEARIADLERRNRSVEWLFDRTPKFTVSFRVPASLLLGEGSDSQTAELKLCVDKGRITGDSSISALRSRARGLEEVLRTIDDHRFTAAEIAGALETTAEFAGLARWFRQQDF